MDLFFVVDASESIIQDDPYGKPLYHWGHIKDYLKAVVDNLPVSRDDLHVGLVKYSDDHELVFHLQQYYRTDEIGAHIERLSHMGGNTNTETALESVHTYITVPEYGARPDARKIVVLLTDGMSNVNQYRTIPKALEMKQNGIKIFVVSMETDVDEAELASVASDPTEDHMIVQSFTNGPTQLIEHTVYGVCDLPVPTPAPPSEY